MRRGRRGCLLLAFGSLLLPRAILATTIFPISDAELRARSRLAVEGVVLRVETRRNARGVPETQTTTRPDRVFKGGLRGNAVLRDRYFE